MGVVAQQDFQDQREMVAHLDQQDLMESEAPYSLESMEPQESMENQELMDLQVSQE